MCLCLIKYRIRPLLNPQVIHQTNESLVFSFKSEKIEQEKTIQWMDSSQKNELAYPTKENKVILDNIFLTYEK